MVIFQLIVSNLWQGLQARCKHAQQGAARLLHMIKHACSFTCTPTARKECNTIS